MSDQHLLYDVADHVATITMNRPDRLNPISGQMLDGMGERLDAADRDPEVRVIVLTGAGRGFCSGLDLQGMAGGDAGLGGGGSPDISGHPHLAMRRIDTPVVCRLNGPAAGYGMDLALGADVILAGESALFSPALRRGVLPESGGAWLLPRRLGWYKAAEVAFTGRKLDASELERLGLVNVVVPDDELDAEVVRWCAEMVSMPPLALRATKRSMRLGLDSSFESNSYQVLGEVMSLFTTEDFAEAVASFVEKRDPVYRGR